MTNQTNYRAERTATFDDRQCHLGEGPLWHPRRNQLFWFDINEKKLMSRQADRQLEWGFSEHVSAAGWVDTQTLLIASETGLSLFDIGQGRLTEQLCPLEADNPATRSNDGRADPWGGFWIGMMGKRLEPEAGAIYRFYKGELRRMFSRITIPNAISFSPDGSYLYFADTPQRRVWRQRLRAADGWPTQDAPEIFLDLTVQDLNPDGAVVDQNGYLWNAQWGASRVARYAPDGSFDRAVSFPAAQISCPAFGGPELKTLFATSAREGLAPGQPADGRTFAVELSAPASDAQKTAGQPEHQIAL